MSGSAASGRQHTGKDKTAGTSYKTGSIWIDPDTHHIMQKGPDEKLSKSGHIYAVGAMTRGQIINASMATISGPAIRILFASLLVIIAHLATVVRLALVLLLP